MVNINRIYTRTGDDGTTGLGDGTRVPKGHLRIESYGTVDELSSVIGLALVGEIEPKLRAELDQIQNDLFDVGADLCVPAAEDEEPGSRLRITPDYVERLEGWIDVHNEALQPLKTFILPGGSKLAAWMHLGRTVCRRAERNVYTLCDDDPRAVCCAKYLNRLSDYLFVVGRVANDNGAKDRLWVPGGKK